MEEDEEEEDDDDEIRFKIRYNGSSFPFYKGPIKVSRSDHGTG